MAKERSSTAISRPEADRIVVRDRDLCDALIGHVSFTAYAFLLITGREPTPAQVRMIDASLVALAEHGLVPSVQAARMTFAAAPDALQGAVAAGLLGCGSVILGASEAAGELLVKIAEDAGTGRDVDERAVERLAEHRAERRPLPGFGHPLHRRVDPRARRLLNLAEEIGTAGPHVAAARALADAVPRVYGRSLPLNASGAIAAVLLDVGFPLRALKAIALMGRTASLVAHLLEEAESPIGFVIANAGEAAVRSAGGTSTQDRG